jgi:hypothetical protein
MYELRIENGNTIVWKKLGGAMARKSKRSTAGWVRVVIHLIVMVLYIAYTLYDGLRHSSGGRIGLGIFWLFASCFIWLISEYPPISKKVYAKQLKWFRDVYSERQIREIGLFITAVAVVLGIFFILAGLSETVGWH